MTRKHQNIFLGSEWVPGQGPELVSTNPADDSAVWQGREADAAQVDQAFAAARDSFPEWSGLESGKRIELVQAFAESVRQSADELALLIARETGKPLWESQTETAAVAAKVAISIDAFHERRDTLRSELGEMTAVTRFKPHGVCAVLGPFNFPAHLPNGHIVPALIAGNTIVFKPSELTPATGAWMVEKWESVGLPAGVLNLVQGGLEVGQSITQNEQLDGLFFTGSSAAGKSIHRALADYPHKILALEMGGNNPLIVHQANDLTAAAYLTILSALLTAGQRCTCARRLILVDDENCQPFLDRLVTMIRNLRVGFYNDQPQPFMGTVITSAVGRKLLESQTQLVQQGGVPLVEMKSLRNCEALLTPGLIDVTEVSGRADEEIFGPLLNVIRVNSFEEAISEANRTAYGLSAGLLSDNPELYGQFIGEIRAGIVNWNRQTTGASGRLPFGGTGLSGNHRPGAWFAADYCSYPVASLESDRLSLPETLLNGVSVDSSGP